MIQLEDTFETNDSIYIVLELHNPLHFDQYIISVETQLEEEFTRDFAIKIAQTLDYLHNNGVIIRNLSLSSFLMSETT